MSKFCKECGATNPDNATVCGSCGAALGAPARNSNGGGPFEQAAVEDGNDYGNYDDNYGNHAQVQNDSLSGGEKLGWTALGCCVPIVGLILWLVWAKEKPAQSRCLRNGFLVYLGCLVIYFIFWIIMAVTGIGLGAMSSIS